MHSIAYVRQHILMLVQEKFQLSEKETKNLVLAFNQDPKFGDLSLNAAFVIGKIRHQPANEIANQIVSLLTNPLINEYENKVAVHIKKADIANNGFINIDLTKKIWQTTAVELAVHPAFCFKLFDDEPRKSFLIEFVSANPTGPLSLAHGRNAIIGDVLAKVLNFLGHKVTKEFYVNDAGQQICNLGHSLKNKVYSMLGLPALFDQVQYDNEYMTELAEKCVNDFGEALKDKDDYFFQSYAKNFFLVRIKNDLTRYGVEFDSWASEEELHKSGQIKNVLNFLAEKNFSYEQDGALWFKSSELGDEKDRVLVKQDKVPTYLVPDIAYHKVKFDRKFDYVINILGQDHHGYEKRLLAAVKALGYDPEKLKCLFYQLVLIKQDEKMVRMSKRRGTFKSLVDVIDEVGVDVARFFYLNKKADAHLNFDLELALKKSEENPVFYIQYAYVRMKSILNKALEVPALAEFVKKLINKTINEMDMAGMELSFDQDEIEILKKICSLRYILIAIANSYQTHLLANYTCDLAQVFHSYYNSHKIVDANSPDVSATRLLLVFVTKNTLSLCLDLLGLSKPDRM